MDNKIMDDNILKNERLVFYIFHKHFFNFKNTIHEEDFIQVGRIAVWRSIIYFNESQNTKLSTYIYVNVLNSMKKYIGEIFGRSDTKNGIAKRQKEVTTIDISSKSDKLNLCYGSNKYTSNQDILNRIGIEEYFKKKSKKDKLIFDLRILDYSQSEIARVINVSQSCVGKKLNKMRRDLKEYIII